MIYNKVKRVNPKSSDCCYCCSAAIVVQFVMDSSRPHGLQRQVPLSFTVSLSLLKLVSIESVMPSNHLILCCPLLLLPSIFPSIRVFSNESVAPYVRLCNSENQTSTHVHVFHLSSSSILRKALIEGFFSPHC